METGSRLTEGWKEDFGLAPSASNPLYPNIHAPGSIQDGIKLSN